MTKTRIWFISDPAGGDPKILAEADRDDPFVAFVHNEDMLEVCREIVRGFPPRLVTLSFKTSKIWQKPAAHKLLSSVMRASSEAWSRAMFERTPFSAEMHKWGIVVRDRRAANTTWRMLQQSPRYDKILIGE